MENDTILTVVQETNILGKEVNLYRSIEEPLFDANEVAGWLGVQNVSQMLKQAEIDESDKVIFLKYTLGGNQKTLFITEDAMYEVLMRSRKRLNLLEKKLNSISNLFVLLVLLFLLVMNRKW